MRLEVDPTGLKPGDTVVSLGDHDLSGCHCDVRVTVDRPPAKDSCDVCGQQAETEDGLLAEHAAVLNDGSLPGALCPGSGTDLYIARNCVCERVINECRCGAAERE